MEQLEQQERRGAKGGSGFSTQAQLALAGSGLYLAGLSLWRVQASGAVPEAEFPPVIPVYQAIPFLLGAGILLAGLGSLPFKKRATGSPDRAHDWSGCRRGGVLLLLLGWWFFPLASLGALLVGAAAIGTLAQGIKQAPLPEEALEALETSALILRKRRLASLFTSLAALATLAALGLSFLESHLFTARFLPRIVSPAALKAYQLSLPGLALFAGLDLGLMLLLALLAAAFVLRLSWRYAFLEPRRVAAYLALLVGEGVGFFLYHQVRLCLGDEIDQLGLRWPLVAVMLSLGTSLAFMAGRRLLLLSARDSLGHNFPDLPAILLHLLLLCLMPPRWLLGRRLERRILHSRALTALLVCTEGSILLYLVGPALYPVVEDFRMQLFDSFAWLVLACASVMLLAWTPFVFGRPFWRRALPLLGLVLLALAFLDWWLVGLRPDVRLVAQEYSRFGASFSDATLSSLLDPFPVVGLQPAGPGGFPFETPADKLLTKPPPALLARWQRAPIIIVLWDAARPDHCSAYGYQRPTTPHLKALAKAGILFKRAYSMATATTTAVRMLLSGCYCSRYMLGNHYGPFLVKDLGQAGYRHFIITVTGTNFNGVSAEAFRHRWNARRKGLAWIDLRYPNKDRIKPDAAKTREAIAAMRRLLRSGEAPGLRGVFAYIHLTGTHVPWTHTRLGRPFGSSPVDLYDEEMSEEDHLLGELVAALKKMGVYEDCILMVVADHGTGLGEHGKLAGFLTYEEQIRIPLVLKVPGLSPLVVDQPVGAIDVAPTLINLQTTGRHRFQGRSLLPLMLRQRKTLPPRPMVSFCAFQDSYAILDGEARFKLIYHRARRYEALFDLLRDPGEHHNLIIREPARARQLRQRLGAFLWAGRASYGNPFHYRPWKR